MVTKECLPKTVNISVFVKCLYKVSLIIFFLILRVRVVWTSEVKIHQHMETSNTVSGISANICLFVKKLFCREIEI